MLNKAPLERHEDSSTRWTTRTSTNAISILIVVLVMLELHIRRLITRLCQGDNLHSRARETQSELNRNLAGRPSEILALLLLKTP